MAQSRNIQQSQRCMLLDLPIEVRLLIYEFALEAPKAITISSCPLKPLRRQCQCEDGFNHLTVECPRIPQIPLVTDCLDPTLLLESTQRLYYNHYTKGNHAADSWLMKKHLPLRKKWYMCRDTGIAMRLSCQLIKAELRRFERYFRFNPPDVYVTYPHGLRVLWNHGRHLLRHCRTLNISGHFHIAPLFPEEEPQLPEGPGPVALVPGKGHVRATIADADEYLNKICSVLMGPFSVPAFESLEMRIYHPGPVTSADTFATSLSPFPTAMSQFLGACYDLEIWQSKLGIGGYLKTWWEPGRLTSRCAGLKLGDTLAENTMFILNADWTEQEALITDEQDQTLKIADRSGTWFTGTGEGREHIEESEDD